MCDSLSRYSTWREKSFQASTWREKSFQAPISRQWHKGDFWLVLSSPVILLITEKPSSSSLLSLPFPQIFISFLSFLFLFSLPCILSKLEGRILISAGEKCFKLIDVSEDRARWFMLYEHSKRFIGKIRIDENSLRLVCGALIHKRGHIMMSSKWSNSRQWCQTDTTNPTQQLSPQMPCWKIQWLL